MFRNIPEIISNGQKSFLRYLKFSNSLYYLWMKKMKNCSENRGFQIFRLRWAIFRCAGTENRQKPLKPLKPLKLLKTVKSSTFFKLTVLSVDDLLSTPGKLTDVSHPKPLQKSKIELANLPGASSTTLPTPSTLRRLVRVYK